MNELDARMRTMEASGGNGMNNTTINDIIDRINKLETQPKESSQAPTSGSAAWIPMHLVADGTNVSAPASSPSAMTS